MSGFPSSVISMSPLSSPLHVSFVLSNVSVAATGRLALDADGIAALALNQLLNVNCTCDQVGRRPRTAPTPTTRRAFPTLFFPLAA